jgi:hypothetical protein
VRALAVEQESTRIVLGGQIVVPVGRQGGVRVPVEGLGAGDGAEDVQPLYGDDE